MQRRSFAFLHAAVCDRHMRHVQLDGVGAHNKVIAYDRRALARPASKREIIVGRRLMAVIGATRTASRRTWS
jgi:hypothetical protein